MKIAVVGMGYMGLPTALLFAKGGHNVVGFDISEKKITGLQKGILPFDEKGLQNLYIQAKDNFVATLSKEDIKNADCYLVAVPTPITEEKTCDLSFVQKAMESVASVLTENNTVILESTVKPKTTTSVVKPILDKAGVSYHLAYVSEKAIPGNTLHEMIHNDRIIGGIDDVSTLIVKKLYASFVKGEIHLTDCTTAESVKLMENTYRDVNIALANELAILAKRFGINVWKAISLANKHPRVNIHQPGPGVGGHCIAVDPWFLAEGHKDAKLIRQSREINDSMPQQVVDIISQIVPKGSTISVLGVAYKKNVDDARETPATKVIGSLKESGYNILVSDPFVKNYYHEIIPLEKAVELADSIVIITDHDIYSDVSWLDYAKKKIDLFDTKCCLDLDSVSEKGHILHLLGDYS